MLDYNSPLIRKTWVVEGMICDAHKSFWLPYMGNSSESIIYTVNDIECGLKKLITYDFSGKLTGAGYEGMDEWCGIGEMDRKFSDEMKMRVFNWATKSQLKTDACDINDLELYMHGGARGRLIDLYMRHKDQFIFDTLVRATKDSCHPTHIYNLGCNFEFQDLAELSRVAREGIGFYKPNANGTVSDIEAEDRYPLEGFRIADGRPVYLLVITSQMETSMKNNPKYQTIMIHADVRGNNNAIFKGMIGEHEGIVCVTAPVFAGMTKGTGQFNPIVDSQITFSGLRRFAVGAAGVQVWQGQKAFRVIEKSAKQEKLAIITAREQIPGLEAIVAREQQELTALALAVTNALNANPVIQADVDDAEAALTAGEADVVTAQANLDAAILASEATVVNKVYSRGLLLGQSAAKFANGMSPDYQIEPTKFKRSYDSILDVFMNTEIVSLELEMGEDYEGAPVTDMDYGMVAVDMEE